MLCVGPPTIGGYVYTLCGPPGTKLMYAIGGYVYTLCVAPGTILIYA